MAIKITADHPTIALKSKIQELSQQFMLTFGFNYFQYLRCFSDGSITLLTNNTGPFEYFQNSATMPLVYSAFSGIHANSPSYWFLWDEELPSVPVQVAKEKFGIFNGLTLVRRSKNYYDMIAVGLPKEQPNPGSFYLNKLKAIECFINQFDKQNQNLIQLINQNPIAVPELNRDSNYKNICLAKGRVTVLGKQGPSYITCQELACLRSVLQGASYKESAKLLGMSVRTVETYLARIKQRTGLQLRSELEWMLSSCP